MHRKGQILHVAGEWLERSYYAPEEFEIGEFWAVVINSDTDEIQLFERIPDEVKLADLDDMLAGGNVGEYRLDVDRLFRENEFTMNDNEYGWIVKIMQVQPYVMAELVTPILIMAEEFRDPKKKTTK